MALQKEVKAIAALLEAEAEDTHELAERIIESLDEMRSKVARYYAVAQIGTERGFSRPLVLGPFSTYLRALQGAQRGVRCHERMDQVDLAYRFMVGVGLNGTNDLADMYVPIAQDEAAKATAAAAKGVEWGYGLMSAKGGPTPNPKDYPGPYGKVK